MWTHRWGQVSATLYFPLSGLNPLPEVDLDQIKLADRLGPCFHSRYFLCDSPRGHQMKHNKNKDLSSLTRVLVLFSATAKKFLLPNCDQVVMLIA